MADQVPEVYMNELNKIEEFHKSFEENGMKPEEFVTYGGFRDTLTTFIAGYDDLCKLIRGYTRLSGASSFRITYLLWKELCWSHYPWVCTLQDEVAQSLEKQR